MNGNMKYLDLVCLLIVVSVFVLGGYWAAQSGIRKQRSIVQARQQYSQRVKELERVEKELKSFQQSLDNSKKELAYLNDKIPESSEIGVFLKEIGALMKEKQLSLTSVQPLTSTTEGPFTRIPIRLIFQGPFIQVFRIVKDLESMERIVMLEKIIMKRGSGAEICQVDLEASIFER
ncbi:type 4a pilus biogenesis protein PilO [Thermodesulfobacteriota bacterium]